MSRLAKHSLAGALLLLAANLSVNAQERPEEVALRADVDQRGQSESEERDLASRASETGAVDAAPDKDEVSISAGKDKSVAKISLSRDSSLGRLTAALSTPINQRDDATQFFTLDGPAEDVKLDLEWKRKSFGLRRLPKVDFPELTERRLELCDRFAVPQGTACTDTELENAMTAAGRPSSEIAQALDDFFTVKIVGTNKPVPLLRVIPYRDFLVGGSVGRTERTFFDLPDSQREDDRLSYSLSASYRRIFESSRVTVSLATQRKFKEAEKARKCAVVDSSTLERCKDLPLGEAAVVDSVPFTVEYRLWRKSFAVSPKLAYDFEQQVAAASLPLYLITDSAGKLTGGIRVDWEEHKDPVAFVFVSSPLGLD